MSKSDLVDLEVVLHHQTDKAVLVALGDRAKASPAAAAMDDHSVDEE